MSTLTETMESFSYSHGFNIAKVKKKKKTDYIPFSNGYFVSSCRWIVSEGQYT